MFWLSGIEMIVRDCGSTFATSALLRTLDTTSVGGVCRKVADIAIVEVRARLRGGNDKCEVLCDRQWSK